MKPSLWSLCMWVKKIAFTCDDSTLICESRSNVPRPESNCSRTALQLSVSSP